MGRDSLRDMRRLLGVLRDGTEGGADAAAPTAPQPTLDELDDLVETYRAAGLPVVVRRSGTPPTSDAVQVVVYRAVQEALTNSLRYAVRPSRVLVSLAYGGQAEADVVVEVTDDGAVGAIPAESVGTERGLVGLRERAALFDGTLQAGRRLDGPGWRVRLVLPGAAEAAGPEPDARAGHAAGADDSRPSDARDGHTPDAGTRDREARDPGREGDS